MILVQAIKMPEGNVRLGARAEHREPEGAFSAVIEAVKTETSNVSGPKPEGEEGSGEVPEKKEQRKGIRVGDMIMVMSEAALSALNAPRNGIEAVEAAEGSASGGIGEIGAANEAAGVFILEGTKEIATPEAQEETVAKQASEGEEARMPEIGKTDGDNATATAVEGTESCPLENENDEPEAGASGLGKPEPELEETKAEPQAREVEKAEEKKPEKAEKRENAEASSSKPSSVNQPIDVSPEKASSNIQMRTAAESMSARPAVASPENLFETMVEQLEVVQKAESSQMTIQLKPEFLGKVSLEMTMSEGAMQVKIKAEDAEVRSMIGGQVSALVETLSNRGIKVTAVEVVYTGVPDGTQPDSQGGGQGSQSERGTTRNRQAERIGGDFRMEIPGLEQMSIGAENSSVEYRA